MSEEIKEPVQIVDEKETEYNEKITVLTEQFKKLTSLYEEQLQRNLELHKKVLELSNQIDTLVAKNIESGVKIHSFEDEEEKPIEIILNFKPTSPRIHLEFAKLDVTSSKEILSITEEYEKLSITNKIDEMTPEENVKFFEYKEKKQKAVINQLLTFFKLAFDDKQNVTEEKTLLRSGFDSEFYQNINLGEVQSFVISFRMFYQI